MASSYLIVWHITLTVRMLVSDRASFHPAALVYPYRQPGYDADAQDIHACYVRFAAVTRLCRTFRGRFADVTRSVSHVSRMFRTFRGPYTHLRAPTQPRHKAIAHHSRTFRNVSQRSAALRAEPMHTIRERFATFRNVS